MLKCSISITFLHQQSLHYHIRKVEVKAICKIEVIVSHSYLKYAISIHFFVVFCQEILLTNFSSKIICGFLLQFTLQQYYNIPSIVMEEHAMADIMISTENLTKKYGNKTVVDNVSLTIERGAIVGLVGQNGAGKTTLIRILTGLVSATSGTFSLLPNQIRKTSDVAAIVERPSIYSNLSAMDNLIAQSTLLGLQVDRNYLSATLSLVGLDATLSRPVKNYSLGMKQRLAIAMTLVGKPQLLILDEPTNGLDPEGIADMREIFLKLNHEMGVTIIISSHILSELGKFATEFYIMDKGQILKRVSADELKSVNGARIRLYVDNTEKAIEALKPFGAAEKIGPDQVSIRTDAPITQLILTLAQAEVVVRNFAQSGDPLEDFYLEIIREARMPKVDDVFNGGAL